MLKWLTSQKDALTRYLGIALGNILITAAYAFITVPNEIINGGVTSFSMVLERLTSIDISIFVNVITISILLICFVFLGRAYFVGSLFSCGCYLAFFTFFHSWGISMAMPMPLCVVILGILVGCGYFLCIRFKSTTVGFDAIALILNKRNPKINVAFAMYVINVAVLLSGLVSYGILSVGFGILFSAIQAGTLNILLKLKDACHRELATSYAVPFHLQEKAARNSSHLPYSSQAPLFPMFACVRECLVFNYPAICTSPVMPLTEISVVPSP